MKKIPFYFLIWICFLSRGVWGNEIFLPFKYTLAGRDYRVYVFFPAVLRREFGARDHIDLILSSLSKDKIQKDRKRGRDLLRSYRRWLVEVYDGIDLVAKNAEAAMVERMLGTGEFDYAVLLIADEAGWLGSLRIGYSTDLNPIPRAIQKLNQPKLNQILAPLPVQFKAQNASLLMPSPRDRERARIQWDARYRWWGAGTAYMANYVLKENSPQTPTLKILHEVAIVTKVWERGGQSVPTSAAWPNGYRAFANVLKEYLTGWELASRRHGGAENPLAYVWPKGIPERFRKGRLGVLNERYVITCDAEKRAYIRLYQGFGYEKKFEFRDPARGNKRTAVMVATKDDFMEAIGRRVELLGNTESHSDFRLQYLRDWEGEKSSEVNCAGHLVDQKVLSSSKANYSSGIPNRRRRN